MESLLTAILSTLLLIGIWWLYFIEYPRYRVDKTRQKFFAARDRLFEDWDELGLPFDSKAYDTMRTTLNGMIRFAHTLSVTRLIGASVADRFYMEGRGREIYSESLSEAMEGLDPEARAAIERARHTMHEAIAEHLVSSSLVLKVAFLVLTIFHVTNQQRRKLCERVATFDAEAKLIGHREARC